MLSLYHLLFTAIVCFFIHRKSTAAGCKVLNVIAVFNVALFAFVFSKISFSELQQNLLITDGSSIAFYLHYFSLALMLYFFYLIYNTNRKKKVFQLFENRIAVWIGAFLVIFILSSELILHGLQFMNAEMAIELSSKIEESNAASNSYRESIFAKRKTVSTAKLKAIKTALPVLWGVLAFTFLLIGIKRALKEIRIIALALLGITIVKLFTYDISNVSETGKIIAFILLGVLILIISFVYQRIKTFVIDEDKNNDNEKIS